MTKKDTRKGLVARVKEAVKRYSFFGRVEEIANRRRHAYANLLKQANARVERAEASLEAASETRHVPVIEDAMQVLAIARHHQQRMLKKREFWRNRYTWAHARHNHWGLVRIHRRNRLRRWIRQHQNFQPYMANGNPYEKLTPEAKHGIYLDFRDGNYVTSTYEGYPGDGVHATSSGHYIQNQRDGRARCWDAGAGSRGPMVKAQLREARRCPAFLIEMIGPENSCEYKNGVRYTLAEGDPLEQMHDTHKHTWIRDGAPT